MKRQNPYSRLHDQFHTFAVKARTKAPVPMWSYSKASIDRGDRWTMETLRERIIAARQLGREVEIVEVNGDLLVQYVNKRPEYPL